ncbi:MAG: carboxypeptidase regulatory-like domain-containing protein [Gammaproteobacteria bacterium]|nr:carboxypeptidase regulatory-like domain-containing protein [Gammaproteobacteria bacterium]
MVGGVVALTGRVERADGEPMKGARVTAIAEGRRVTVFSNADGAFALPELTAQQLEVRADGMQPQRLDSHADGASIVMEPAIDRAALLPSSHWLSLLPDGPMRREFTLNCGSCHGIAHPTVTSAGEFRDEALWLAAMAMMRAVDVYSVIPPDFDDAQYAAWLAEHLTPTAAAAIALPQPPADDLLDRLLITEYDLPQGDSLPHDLVLGPDGRVWITAFFYDQVWGLDPASGDYRKIDIDDDPQINAQARALEFAEDGRLWVVNGETRSVIRLNVETGEYETFDVRMYAHSLDLDTSGNVWVNDYFAAEERIAKVDARTGDVTIIGVPRSGRPASEGIPLPYGLQVDGNDRLYSTQLAANTLVVHDTRTGEAKLLAMPAENSGPRRPGLAPDGSLWIPEFNTGHITRFSPETEDFDRIYLGMPTIGAYDIEVDQRSGIVWTTGSLDSSLFRYDPSTGRIDRIPLPTEPAYTRHLAIDPQTGDVWSAYSPLPPATPRVVRVQLLPQAGEPAA